MTDKDKLPERSSRADVDQFLRKVAATPVTKRSGERGRLIFALDATASRQPTWDRACQLQSEMFLQTAALGGLEIQLVYYRGFNECRASGWHTDSDTLLAQMGRVYCLAGTTQIGRVLQQVIRETRARPLQAAIFVGDALEESIDELAKLAGELGILNVPLFLFQEGHDPLVESGFKRLASLTGGAWCRFDSSSAGQLRHLLSAVAIFAAGGHEALEDFSKRAGPEVQLLTRQLSKR